MTDKFYNGEWDILGLHEFIRLYFQKLDERAIASHSPQYVVLGTLILWLGWLLFNGGSSLGIIGDEGKQAKLAIVNTILSPSAAGLFTFYTKRYITGQNTNMRMDYQAMTNGILAGAVTITGCCNCVEPWAALIIGILGSLVYSLFCKVLDYFKIDDPMDAFQVHGACGLLGSICVALFEKDTGMMYDSSKGWPQLGI